LSAAARVFEELSNSDPEDAAAWYNLGLARAWLGDNVGALEALDRYVTLEPHAPKAAAAWALAEVLRQGYGMGEQSDHLLYVVGYEIRDPRPVEAILQDWQRGRRLLPVQVSKEQDVFTALILDTGPVFSATPGVTDLAPMAAYLLIAPGFVRLSGPVKERLERARAELEQKAGSGLSPLEGRVMTAPFTDVVSEAVVYPVGITDQKEALRRLQERVAQFFEGTWLQRPLRSLNGNAPIDAAGHAVLKKKLRGVVDFLQQCAEVGTLQGYDFDRVRRKLGLLETAAAASSGIPADLTALGAAELAALPIEAMSEQQLEQAFRTAQRLDATEVGTRLARALVARPPSPERADRYPVYNYLLQRAVADGQMDEALACINEGEKVDGEHNEGRRRNDYELRRAQLHARRAEPDASFEVFERLIQRDPENVKHRVAATEAMLALKQGPRAAKFAEEGLVQARKQNNRDAEQHLLELSAAARKLGG
jgi:tetratricopeptide (TPR) repeat protein